MIKSNKTYLVRQNKVLRQKRDLELENIAGNLMIAEYQVDKLRQRLSQQVTDVKYRSFGSKKTSAHTFKYNGKWYKVSIKVEEVSLDRDNNTVKSQDQDVGTELELLSNATTIVAL